MAVLAMISITLKDQWWKALADDLNLLDSEESTKRVIARNWNMRKARGAVFIAQQASDIFEEYLSPLIKLAKRTSN